MSGRALILLALLTATLACNGPAASTGGFVSGSPGPTSAPAGSETSTGEASTGGGSTAGSEESGAGSTGTVRDLGGAPDFGPDKPLGCKGKIDFLFLISRAGQMQTAQQQLLASFPGFIDTIETMFPEFDTHIMVANPEGTWAGWGCEKDCNFNACSNEGEGEDYVCGPASYEQVTKCDEVLGAGLLFNAGPYATNTPCALVGGRRYIVTRDEPDPLAAFQCIARVGTYGYGPPTGDALIAALSPYLSVGACNKGFLRDDALLFITFIIDSEDEKSKTYVSDWYKAVVKAKHGDPGAVVTLLVTPQYALGDIPGCVTAGNHKNKLRDLITMFPYHVEGDICAPSYAPYFNDAAKLVGQACASFAPQ